VDVDTGARLSHFMITRSHQKETPDYCSAHMGNVVPATDRYLLTNAWYTGGVDVIDFSNPRAPKEVAFYDDNGDEWSGYWYEQDGTDTTGPFNAFGTHGVEHIADGLGAGARGFEAFLANVAAERSTLDHLNPQVQERAFPTPTGAAAGTATASRHKKATARKASRSPGEVDTQRVLRHLAP
jgi:hypothetical protein